MIKCEICEKELKNLNSLSKHIKIHKITHQEYYSKYIKLPGEGLCKECGSKTTYMNMKEGFRKYCHDPCPTPQETNKVLKESMKKKYNVDNISKLDWVKEKKKKTAIKNYGSLKAAHYDTLLVSLKEKYNTDNFYGLDWVKEKRQKTFDEKFGGHPMYDPDIKQKLKNTYIQKYGVDSPMKVEKFKLKSKHTYMKNFFLKLEKFLEDRNLILLNKYEHAHIDYKFKCKICNTIFVHLYNSVQQGYQCPKCFPRLMGTSIAEQEIYNFICDLIGSDKVEHNCWNLIKNPKTNRNWEIDIYIPSKQIAIEYDGFYWHSEQSPNYHLNKTIECEKLGIQLIHIFEDEWMFKQDIVKSRIKQILNINDNKRIHARKCIIKEIDPKVKNEFLETYHIQGKDASKIKLGAFYNEKLISVMTFGKGNISKGSRSQDKVWELNRFCSNSDYHIPGIAGKLLSYFKKNFEWKEIFSYSDRRWSQGNLYTILGFELEHITNPNYWYLKDYSRIHRFGLRKTKDEPKDIPEWILRAQEGYLKIWDCGSLKFNALKNNVIF